MLPKLPVEVLIVLLLPPMESYTLGAVVTMADWDMEIVMMFLCQLWLLLSKAIELLMQLVDVERDKQLLLQIQVLYII